MTVTPEKYEDTALLWVHRQLLDELAALAGQPSGDSPRRITISGVQGTGKGELVNHFLSRLPENMVVVHHHDFEIDPTPLSQLPSQILRQFYIRKLDHFKEFLAVFSRPLQNDITATLREINHRKYDAGNWVENVFLQFLTFLAKDRVLLFIFANVRHISRLQTEQIEGLVESVSHLPALFIFTEDTENPDEARMASDRIFTLTKLSLQEVERSVQENFQTSTINARLITNHCYLKTGGNPLRIRFLLEAVYRPLIDSIEDEFLNVKRLQKIKISGEWEHIFAGAFASLTEDVRSVFMLAAHLDEQIAAVDLDLMLRELGVPQDEVMAWLRGGFFRKSEIDGETAYGLSMPVWKNWIRQTHPLDEIKDLLLKIVELDDQNRLSRVYRISQSLYDLGLLEPAIRFAEKEAEMHLSAGQLSEAADRLYFLIRIWHFNPGLISNSNNILEKLGELYLQIGAHENAFEVLRKLREAFTSRPRPFTDSDMQQWLRVNIKMTRALIAMDSYQEARYILRELRVKEFCDPATVGECMALSGDIELNLSHFSYALKNYREAMGYFEQTADIAGIFQVYSKLKPLLKDNPDERELLIDRILTFFRTLPQRSEYMAPVLADRIQISLHGKDYRAAYQSAMELRRLLRRFYQPQLYLQLGFYLGEIYVQFGKWDLAISHLEAMVGSLYVKHRPLLLVQAQMQLALMYKEQARYGAARRLLGESLELCYRHRLFAEQNEIKLHLGHLYLLSHGLMQAYQYLNEAREWAETNQQQEVLLQSLLYMAYYELQQKRYKQARIRLKSAKKILNLSRHPIDSLNYLFYFALWLLETGRISHARTVVNLMFSKASEIPRYIAAANYLMGKTLLSEEKGDEAESALGEALEISRKWKLPQIEYLATCELVRLKHNYGSEEAFGEKLQEFCRFLEQMAGNMDDEILQAQFLEARFHEDIIKWCRQYFPE